ncbi:MAG: esterase-like activity of phytase family protein [Verrucomicrobia bacterium]|nr:esterase-like activity of phytase family protein [Verrucomicrobiota bacterium]
MRTLTRSLLVAAAASISLSAGPITYTTPNLDTTAVGVTKTVSFNGASYLNKGLVGVGTYASGNIDGLGDTLGSFSSFKVDATTWRKNADGSYAGSLYTLPDRGYNVAGLIDYAARIQKFDLAFTPDYTTNTVGQTQVTLTFKNTIKITDFNGSATTAVNPTASTLGSLTNVPVANGKLSLDAEGLAIRSDGSFYISDEYGASILNVSKTGKLLGVITPVQALIPQFSNSAYTGFTTESAAVATGVQTGGRRDNQGMEAVDITPDGKYLVAMLQSATRQDTPSNSDFNRAYTRLFVYDITKTGTPSSPIGHYLVELPTLNTKGIGVTADKTAAQSEIVALSSSTFMVLTRDGSGNGSGKAAYASGSSAVGYADVPMVFKSIALVSTANATNLAGTVYETGYTTTVTGTGPTLAPVAGIVAATTTDFVNLLNVNQLARFGLNLNTVGASGVATAALAGRTITAASTNSLSEKWEALSVVSCLDAANPNDYFLLVGNDNDFITPTGTMLGTTFNALSSVTSKEVVDSPNRILVYRVTLPGYVDPGLVVSATNRAPGMASKSLRSTQLMGTSFGSILKGRLSSSMRLAAPKAASPLALDFDWQAAELTSDLCASGMPQTHGTKGGLRWWFDGSIRNISEDASSSNPALDSRSNAGAVGLEWQVGTGFVFGIGVGMQDGKSDGNDGSHIGYTGRSVTSYLLGRGDVFFGSFTVTAGTQDFNSIQSAGAYGSTPSGATEGQSLSAEFNLGATVAEIGGWSVVPMVGLSHTSARVDGYAEAGIGGITYPTQHLKTNTASASVELAKAFAITNGTYTPFVRVGFDHDFGGSDQTSNVSVSTNGGSVGVAMTLPNADRDYTVGTLGMRWKLGELNAEASYEYRSGDNGYQENRFNLSLSSSF